MKGASLSISIGVLLCIAAVIAWPRATERDTVSMPNEQTQPANPSPFQDRRDSQPQRSAEPSPTATPSPLLPYTYPTEEFGERITKKFFGTHVTPTDSPVQPERFSGYHTGIDVEFVDIVGEVPVFAFAAGEVTQARTASGYGGLVVIVHMIDDQALYGIYGHLDPTALPTVGRIVERGQRIGHLGEGETNETGGERKHLHFGLSRTEDIRGYVDSKAGLGNWLDPVQLLPLASP